MTFKNDEKKIYFNKMHGSFIVHGIRYSYKYTLIKRKIYNKNLQKVKEIINLTVD